MDNVEHPGPDDYQLQHTSNITHDIMIASQQKLLQHQQTPIIFV